MTGLRPGMVPPKAYWPPMPITMMEAITAMFLEENMSTFLSIMIAMPWAAMALSILLFGPGGLSLDALIRRAAGRRCAAPQGQTQRQTVRPATRQ